MKTKLSRRFLSFLTAMLLTVVVVISCEKNDILFPDPSTLPGGLKGSWVEISTIIDTITFHSDKDTGFFYLSRGFEMYNGYWLPKIGSAPYAYLISDDSIQIVDGTYGSMVYDNYYFNFNEPELIIRIGKFTKYLEADKTILTFKKIR